MAIELTPTNGQPSAEPTVLGQGQPGTPEPTASGDLADILAEGQEPTPQDGQPNPTVDPATHWQRIAEQRQQELYKAEARMRAVEEQRQQQALPTQEPQNPYIPGTVEYWARNNEILAERVASMTEARVQKQFQTMVQQAQEMTWAQQHPGVDLNAVKERQRQVSLEDAYKLMTLQDQLTAAQTRGAQTTAQAYRQPQAAAPLRGNPVTAAPGAKFSFDKALQKSVEDSTWLSKQPPEFQSAFNAELSAREAVR